MDGRWTIRVCACTVASVKDRGPALPTPCERERLIREVAVVPCDDAAVERGAEALVKLAARWGMGEWHPEGAREMVEAVLRAAGESGPDPSKRGLPDSAERGAVGPTNPRHEGGES